MKSVLMVIVFSAVTSLIMAQPPTDWKRNGLKGKVKSLTQRSEHRYKKDGVFTPWEKSFSKVTRFNAEGMNTRYDELLANDSLSYRITYTYNKRDNKADVAYFDRKLNPTIKKVFVYDAKGYKTEENEYTKEGQPDRRYLYTYDAKGNILTITGYNKDNKLTSKTTWKYDDRNYKTDYLEETPGYAPSSRKFVCNDKGNVTEETWLNGKNEINFRYLRTYDKYDNMIQEMKYKGRQDKLADLIHWTYTYDAKGNWIKQVQSTSDGQEFHIEERVIVYY